MSELKNLLIEAIVSHIKNLAEQADQEHTSAPTSIPQASSGLKLACKTGLIKPHSKNVDVGGGKYDLGKEHVEANVEGATLHVHDKYNRSEEHNKDVEHKMKGNADYVGSHNVGNVIKEDEHLHAHLEHCKSMMKPKTGVFHMSVYVGDANGNSRVTKNDTGRGSSYQRHHKADHYLPHVKKAFPEDTHNIQRVKNGYLVTQK